MGIVGGGMAGLYASLLLQDLGIKSRILESNPDRLGGRVYTYRFDPEEWKHTKTGELRCCVTALCDLLVWSF